MAKLQKEKEAKSDHDDIEKQRAEIKAKKRREKAERDAADLLYKAGRKSSLKKKKSSVSAKKKTSVSAKKKTVNVFCFFVK